jgi:hypothetical protein
LHLSQTRDLEIERGYAFSRKIRAHPSQTINFC